MTTSTNADNNKTALITGSGRNIGRAVAHELAGRGYNIVLNGSSDKAACENVASEVEKLGAKALIAMGNIGVREDADSIASAALNEFGRVDVLVNNAAIRPNFDLLNDDEADFNNVMNVNFYSTLWLTRACLPGMIDNGWGRIIYFTGMNAQQGYTGKCAVSISKHAVWGLTKSIAKEYAKHGVTSNIISPGTIVGEVADPTHVGKLDTLLQNNPSAKLGEPFDIAGTIGYLVGDHSGFVNGQLLQINGGVVV